MKHYNFTLKQVTGETWAEYADKVARALDRRHLDSMQAMKIVTTARRNGVYDDNNGFNASYSFDTDSITFDIYSD